MISYLKYQNDEFYIIKHSFSKSAKKRSLIYINVNKKFHLTIISDYEKFINNKIIYFNSNEIKYIKTLSKYNSIPLIELVVAIKYISNFRDIFPETLLTHPSSEFRDYLKFLEKFRRINS